MPKFKGVSEKQKPRYMSFEPKVLTAPSLALTMLVLVVLKEAEIFSCSGDGLLGSLSPNGPDICLVESALTHGCPSVVVPFCSVDPSTSSAWEFSTKMCSTNGVSGSACLLVYFDTFSSPQTMFWPRRWSPWQLLT